MKVKFFLDNGANIHSCLSRTLDTEKDFGFEAGEWEAMSSEDQFAIVKEWADERIEYWWEPA